MTITRELFETGSNGFESQASDTKDHTLYFEVLTPDTTPERTIILAHGACGTG